jgi:outer membrane protein assembly factor BamA
MRGLKLPGRLTPYRRFGIGPKPLDVWKLIPLMDGEIYNRDKYYGGLSAVSRAHAERGFIDCTVTNTMELDQVNQTLALVMDINVGLQYR